MLHYITCTTTNFQESPKMMDAAQWIAPAGAEEMEPCHFRAEKRIDLEEIPSSVILQIACDSYYHLEINGITVGRGPARGTPFKCFYDEYETASFWRKGSNQISVLCCCMNYPAQASMPVTPALRLAAGDFLMTDSSWQMSLCDREWRAGGPLYCAQTGYAELRDLNFEFERKSVDCVTLAPDNTLWNKELLKRDIPLPRETAFSAVDVPAAAFVPPSDLTRSDFARISTAEEHFPLPEGTSGELYTLALGGIHNVTLPVPPEGGGITFVADFGKEISGFVEIELTADSGVVADIAYEEELYKGDRLRADHTHTNPTYQFADRFILRSGRQKIGSVLMERGYRMVQLTLRNVTKPVTLHAITAIDRRYPFAKRGSFFCGDYQLNRLWEVAAETLSACTTDIFTDCPWRERLFYSNDFLIENRICLKIFGDPRINRRAFRMIFSSDRSDGLFTSSCPSSAPAVLEKGKTDFHVILPGDLMLVTALREYYMHTADLELVRECLPPLRKMMERFASWLDESNILRPPVEYWNFFDWSFELNGMTFSGKRTSLLNFLFVIASRHFDFLARSAGEERFLGEEKISAVLKSTIETFYDPEKKFFLNSLEDPAASMELLTALGVAREELCVTPSSRLTHAMGILAGVEKELCASLFDEKLLAPELYYGIFLLDAMAQGDAHQGALDYIRKYWGAMLDSGTPTLWENGVHKKGKAGFGGSASLCHGFSTAPAAYLQTAVLGIAPLEPGFTRFLFAPRLPELKFAQGHVPTPHGAIRCFWECVNGTMNAQITVPEKCTAETPAGIFGAGTHKLNWKLS